ncbi:unnamed protein product [Sphagnum compactum]
MRQRPIVSAVDCVKRPVKLGTYNVRTCSRGEEGTVELGLLTHELKGVSVGLYGLQELHWPGKGECDVYAQPSGSTRPWKLVWSGRDAQHAEHGVGLLMAPKWADALLFFDQHSPRLISAHFQAKAGQHLTMFSAYSPTDCKDGGVEEEHWLTDHRLLVLSLQLSLRAQQRDAPGRGLWDGEALYVPEVKVAFEGAVSNRFSALNPEVSDPEDEWQKWVHNVSAATLEKVGVRKMRRRHKLGLSPATFKLITAKKATHLAKLGVGASPVSKAVYRAANAAVKKAVARDVNAYLKRQADTASRLREQGRIGDWVRKAKHMAARGTFAKRGAPKALLDRQGLLIHSPEALLQRFSEHFAGVLGGGRYLPEETRVQLDGKVCEIEASLNT